jgi:glycopeptide antibiotics resistance protein
VDQAVLPAAVAIVVGLALAVVAFAPFVALAYRRYRRLTWRYVLAWLGFLIYFMAIWAYTLLFFPDPDRLHCVRPQLRPFYSIGDVFNYPHSSVGQLLHNPVVDQLALNVALFIPLGVFVRLLWNGGLVASTLAGAGLSLFVETTQLTGVWGLYRCAYRVFDVDDIMTNTTGALLGALLALVLPRGWLTPAAQPPGVPAPVTLGRRLIAMVCDGLSVWLIGGVGAAAATMLTPWLGEADPARWATSAAFGAPFAIQTACVLISGRTLGDLATVLRWEPMRPAWLWRRLARLLGGIGGFQLLGLITGPWSLLWYLFALVAVLAAVVSRRSRGLPGLLGRQELADARE